MQIIQIMYISVLYSYIFIIEQLFVVCPLKFKLLWMESFMVSPIIDW